MCVAVAVRYLDPSRTSDYSWNTLNDEDTDRTYRLLDAIFSLAKDAKAYAIRGTLRDELVFCPARDTFPYFDPLPMCLTTNPGTNFETISYGRKMSTKRLARRIATDGVQRNSGAIVYVRSLPPSLSSNISSVCRMPPILGG